MQRSIPFLIATVLIAMSMLPLAALEAKEVAHVKGFLVPECCLMDPDSGVLYVSNIESVKDEYWTDDGRGFISLVQPDGSIKQLRWLDSNAAAPIHAPKGMCLLKGVLYFADNTRLMRCDAKTGKDLREIPLSDAKKLNDLATDGERIYVSDTEGNKLYIIAADGAVSTLEAPEWINGVTIDKGRIFVVSWTLHEVYELDPSGKAAPKPFGVAEHFTNLDGIEVLEDGSFIVSDFKGNKVSHISADRKTVRTLAEVDSAADIGLDRKKGLLYVPSFMSNSIYVYSLR